MIKFVSFILSQTEDGENKINELLRNGWVVIDYKVVPSSYLYVVVMLTKEPVGRGMF